MAQKDNGSPSILGIVILMLAIGMILFVFFAFIRGGGRDFEKPAIVKADYKSDGKARTPDEIAQRVADANQVRAKTMQPVEPDPQQSKKIKQLLSDTSARKPFSNPPAEVQAPRALPLDSKTPPLLRQTQRAEPVGTEDSPPGTQEPAHEVGTSSPEGAAILKDATARIDEASSELYSEKAKSKVKEGLKNARRIFKIYTVYFEKGGASPSAKDKDALNKALTEKSLVDSMGDPRTVFFVLGFADKSGDAPTNKKLSIARSDAVVSLLKNDCGLLNLTYPVAVGSTELVSPENQNKNRAAEIWMVLP